jgi:predicted phage terminase large subunit-like protein
MGRRSSWLDWIASLDASTRSKVLAELSDDDARLMANEWVFSARPDQLPPPGDWKTWVICSGRGWGKTRTGASWVIDEVRSGRASRVCILGRTAGDVRDVMVDGESGILASSPPDFRPEYEPSKRRLTWPNGAIATTFSSDAPSALRGPQFSHAWVDELAAHASFEAWDQLSFGLRLGEHPRALITTTPRPLIRLKKIMEAHDTVVTRGSTMDNRHNLAEAFIEAVVDRYAGTTLGRQELEGELLSELPGALFSRADIEKARVDTHPELERIVVAIDPAITSRADSDESGIIVAGKARGDFYVLEDLSVRATPEKVCRRAIDAYHRFQADRVVVEANQGGDVWSTIIHNIDPGVPVKAVHASRGKATRAEPTAGRYEQGRCHHVRPLPELEDQLCSFIPGETRDSPDRLDALVWAITELDGGAVVDVAIDPNFGYKGPNAWL